MFFVFNLMDFLNLNSILLWCDKRLCTDLKRKTPKHTPSSKKAYFQKQICQQQNDLKRIIFRKSWKVFRFTQIALEVDRCCQRLLSNISLLSKITQQYLFNALQNVIYHLKGRGSRQNTSQPEYQTRVGRVMGEKFEGEI